jgi:hypothetical protein
MHRTDKSMDTGGRLLVTRWGGKKRKHGVSFWEGENVLDVTF